MSDLITARIKHPSGKYPRPLEFSVPINSRADAVKALRVWTPEKVAAYPNEKRTELLQHLVTKVSEFRLAPLPYWTQVLADPQVGVYDNLDQTMEDPDGNLFAGEDEAGFTDVRPTKAAEEEAMGLD